MKLNLKLLLLLTALTFGGCVKSQRINEPTAQNTLLGGKVTFDAPKDWVLQKKESHGAVEIVQFVIPDPTTENTPDSANAGITIEPLQPNVTLTNFGDAKLQDSYKANPHGYAVLTDIFADNKWRTTLSRGQQDKTPYVIMDRFGVDQNVMVHFLVAHPVYSNNFAAVAQSISNFNAIVLSLKIGGTNTVNSETRLDYGTIWLRNFSDSQTNWMVSPTNKPVFRSPTPN